MWYTRTGTQQHVPCEGAAMLAAVRFHYATVWTLQCFGAHLWLKDVSNLGLGSAAVHKDHFLLRVWVYKGADSLPQGAKNEGGTEHDKDCEALRVVILENVKDGVQSAEVQAVHGNVCAKSTSSNFMLVMDYMLHQL